MMWLTSPVTHFLTDVSQGTSPNFSKGWCARELKSIRNLFLCAYDIEDIAVWQMNAVLTLVVMNAVEVFFFFFSFLFF